jgi:hypothetical protein
MHATNFNLRRGASVIAGLALALGCVGAKAATAAKEVDAFPAFDNYINVGAQATSLSGDEAAFQKRIAQPKSGSLGIEDFHYAMDLDKETTMTVDGRALSGAEDYLAKLNLTKNEVGSIEAGYKSFRTFYDGIGGFFPTSKQWNAMNPEDLHVDRGEFWVTAKIKRPNTPEFEFNFTDGSRTGKKDSQIWGDSDFTGMPNNVPPISQVRKMVPSYRKLDEHNQNLNATMRYSVGNTNYSITLLHEKTDDNDVRFGTRWPGEVKPYPTPASTVLLAPAQMNSTVQYSQTDGMETKMNGITGKTDTAITDKVKLLTGFNYQDLDSTFTGDRPINTLTPTAIGPVWGLANNYLNLLGTSKVKVYTGLVALELKLVPALFAKVGLSAEDKRTQSSGTFTSVAAAVSATTGAVTITQTPQYEFSRIKEKSTTPSLDLSYTGIKNFTFYFSGSKQFVSGDERYSTPYNPLTAGNGTLANNTLDDSHEKLNLGFNWTQSSMLSLRGEVFRKDHSNRAIGYDAGAGTHFDLGYKFDGFKLTAIAKPTAQLSFTSRYVYQKGSAEVAGILPLFPTYDSMDVENHMLGETIDWNPNKQFYAQANVNLVYNVVKTLNGRGGITVGTPPNASYSSDTIVTNADNNYITASILGGAVLTKEDDLQIRFTYYKADNYHPAVAALTMPFGAGAKEISVSAGLKHKFSDRCIGNVKIGYYDSKNDTTGGNTNFKGPMAYVSLDYAL